MKMLLFAVAMLPLLAGCPEETTTTTDTPTTADTAADTAGDTTGPDVVAVTNACMNDADFAICDNCTGTPVCDPPNPDACCACPNSQDFAQAVATGCGLSAIGKPDERQFSLDCILPVTGLSNDCGGCYADIVLCSVQNCIAVCLDPSSEACATCQATNCAPAFYACTGYEGLCEDGEDNNMQEGADCLDRSCMNETVDDDDDPTTPKVALCP